jgi:hypothetical protein
MKMNRHKRYPAVLVIMALTVISCETDIIYKGPETEPKPVIYALLRPDSLVTVTVSKSHPVFDVPYIPGQITDATVRLYRDDTLLETLTYQAPEAAPDWAPVSPYSRYVSATYKPEYGHRYRVEVEVPGLPMAYGEASLPTPVTVEVADTSSSLAEWGYRVLTVKLRFRDPAGEDNFYRITANSLRGIYYGNRDVPYDNETAVTVYEDDISYGILSDPLITPRQEDDIFGMTVANAYYLFLDELIAGKEYLLQFTYEGGYPDRSYYEFLHAWFRLSTITEDLYLYLKSYAAHRQTNDNFLAEPVPVYTNITNGLGVVGAMSTTVDSVAVGEYPVDGVLYDIRQY